MKQARIVLFILALTGVIGGISAFKVNTSPSYLYKPAKPGGICTVKTIMYMNIVFSTTGVFTELTTKSQKAPCPTYVTGLY